MGLFSMFKKKDEPSYDPSNITVSDLAQGFVFEYNMTTWEVKEEYEYDWGENFFSKEYKISNGEETLFLSVEEDDELNLMMTKKIKLRKIDTDVADSIMKFNEAPREIMYEGKKYFLEKESPGYFRDISNDASDWDEFISWDYYDDSEELYICVEQWDEKEFEAAAGFTIKEFEISNILPK
ncbi:MAG: hypothetical protein B6I18_06835 [Bacteroidetes bacterium 4572_112]|nr:MAG: hypothetical protein B6I18_06835 [Bacteroidetes bacterium 4572_112]